MGQFKPMVKMTTTEPSVILKLKKGGKVAPVAGKMAASPMAPLSAPSEAGKAPKKPPMAQRMKAMNPNQYAKGGNVGGKQMGGMMAPAMAPAARPARPARGARPMAGPVNPMTRAALGAMAPDQRSARAAMVRKALTGMKKGGSADCSALERELKHHESLSAAKAHKASGGGVSAFAKTKMDTAHHDSAHGTGEVKMGKPAGYKHGGKMVHKAMGGSIMGNEGPYENTKVVSAGKGKTNGTTGGVRMGNGGGFKKGGSTKYANGGMVHPRHLDSVTGKPYDPYYLNPQQDPSGNTRLRNPDMMDTMPDPRLMRASNVPGRIDRQYAKGGGVEGNVSTSKPGKTNTTTGEVKLGNAGGYKHGGSLGKAYATGGNVVDDGKAQKMPSRPVSRPVANNLQSGTFKRGGKVAKNAGGKVADADMPDEAKIQSHIDRNERAMKAWEKSQKEEAESTRSLLPNLARKAMGAVKGMFGSKPPAGSVTKTEKSVTVAPGASAVARKRGGKC